MTDKELLELAAKAAGVKHKGYCEFPSGLTLYEYDDALKLWNPLTDDGDALRLAVKLGYPHMIGTWLGCYTQKGEYEQDPYAATRRAITCAAAEIGRAMEDK